MSQIKLTNDQIKRVSGVGGALIVGGLLWKYFLSKKEPEYVNDDDEISDVIERPSHASTVDLNIHDPNDDDEGWKTRTGGKRSRKRKNNKSKKSRSKSKRRTKK